MNRYLFATVWGILLAASVPADAAIRIVRTGQTYGSVQAAFDASQNGDTIELDSGTYYQGTGWVYVHGKSNITFSGVGSPRPVIDAGNSLLNSKGIIVIETDASNITIQNLELKNTRMNIGAGGNAACVRAQGTGLTMSNCYCHDSDAGVLNGGGVVLFEYCEFNHCGEGDGQSHNIYMNTTVTTFTMRYCWSHNCYMGHEVKTRSPVNYILYNRIGNEASGTGSYEVQCANGGTSYVIGNQIEQDGGGNNTIINYASEGSSPDNHLYVVNNTIVNNNSSGTFVYNASSTGALLENNIFQGNGTILSGAGTQTTNWPTSNAYLLDPAHYDYHLTASSTGAIDAGTTPGTGINGFNMNPTLQYVHPCNYQTRPTVGTIDIGAYEYSSGGDTTPPAAVTNLATSSPTSSSITVSWTAPGDDGNTGTATTYDIRYSTSTINDANWASATQVSGEPAPQVAGTNQNMTISGLSSSTTYYFAMKTADEVPNWSSLSNVATGTTSAPADTTPPAAVTNLSCSNITATSVQLNWTSPGDDGNTGTATTYDIRYSTSVINSGNWASATQVSGEPTPLVAGTNQNMVISGLTADTTYYFAIETADEVPNWSGLSNVPSAHTVDSVAPAAVSNLSISNITAGSVQLNWTAPGDNGSTGTATTYDIRYSTSVINSGNWASATQVSGEPTPLVAGTNQNMVVSGLSGDTTYYFAIETADEVPNWSGLSNVPSAKTSDTVAPAAVTNLATSSPTTSSITLTWTAPGDNGSTGTATTYDIRYSTSTINAGNWASATQVTGEPAPLVAGTNQNMVITGLNPNTTYYFAIETADEVPNWSGLSNVPSGTTAAAQNRTVGSGYTYSTVQAAHDAAADWDTIQIYGGPFVGSAGWANISKNHLTFVGMGLPKPVLDANGSCLSGKGIFNISGTNTTVQNLEFKNARNTTDKNAGGIRQQAANLTITNCYFHDNDDGINVDDMTGSAVLVQNSEFNHNGYGDGYSHNFYVKGVDTFTAQYCYIHNAYAGHELKTRAKVNYILYNRIGNEGGNGSYEIQAANGGTTYIIGNQIEQSSTGSNPTIIDYGSEGSNPDMHLYVVNNTIVNNKGSGTFVNNASSTGALLENNIFQGAGTILTGTGTQTTNWATTNAYLADPTTYYFQLTASSSGAIDAGTTPGTGVNGFNMSPTYQYVHPCMSEARPTRGTLDIGAYEYVPTFQYGVASLHRRDRRLPERSEPRQQLRHQHQAGCLGLRRLRCQHVPAGDPLRPLQHHLRHHDHQRQTVRLRVRPDRVAWQQRLLRRLPVDPRLHREPGHLDHRRYRHQLDDPRRRLQRHRGRPGFQAGRGRRLVRLRRDQPRPEHGQHPQRQLRLGPQVHGRNPAQPGQLRLLEQHRLGAPAETGRELLILRATDGRVPPLDTSSAGQPRYLPPAPRTTGSAAPAALSRLNDHPGAVAGGGSGAAIPCPRITRSKGLTTREETTPSARQ